MKNYNLIVAGGRDFEDYEVVNEILLKVLETCNSSYYSLNIVCGMASGADLLGKRFGEFHNLNILEYPANWSKYGRKAGYIRNVEMSKVADSAIVFWNGISKGSKMMIDIMKTSNKPVSVFDYRGNLTELNFK